MAEAFIVGILCKHVLEPEEIFVSDHKAARVRELHEKYSVQAFIDASFVKDMDMVVLAVKPDAAVAALEEIQGHLRRDTVLVSIVAGLSLAKLEKIVPMQPMIRVMTNTPAAVGEGMAVYALGTHADDAAEKRLLDLLCAAGKAIRLQESLMDAVTGLSGSGSAFVFLVIDALSDGGVAAGLPRKAAVLLAAQTVLGAAKMVLALGKHPDELRDQVTSPNGTTIAGIRVLEERAVRGAFLDAVVKAAEKSKDLGN